MPLLTPEQAAAELGQTPKILKRWRADGRGPDVVYLTKKCPMYHPDALRKFIQECTRTPSVQAFAKERHGAL